MKSPTIKNLLNAFPVLTSIQARLIKRLAATINDKWALFELIEKHCPKTYEYGKSCYNSPYESRMWRTTMVLHAINEILGTFGVEGLGKTHGPTYEPPYQYLNTGETYDTTLIYDLGKDRLYIGCWGDIAERLPYDENTGELL